MGRRSGSEKKKKKSHNYELTRPRERMEVRDLSSSSRSTIDAFQLLREVEEEHVAGSASEQMDVSSLEESLKTTTLELARHTVKVPPPQPILAVNCSDWGISFYIRKDGGGYLHTYPDVGGPFKNLQEAQKAINTFLHRRQDPTMFMDGLSHVERSVKWTLYWPDGTRKTPSKSQEVDLTRNWTHQLARALMDEYNEKHSLMEDHAHQVKEVVCIEAIFEGDVYNHINFTTEVIGEHGVSTNLFFAEVILSTKGELQELVPSCLRMLESSDNGTCHGCQNNGSGEHMKHPKDASEYTGGHVKKTFFLGPPGLPPPMEYPVGDEDGLHCAEEARLRAELTAYEDSSFFEQFKGPHPCPFPARKPLVETEEMRQFWLALDGSCNER